MSSIQYFLFAILALFIESTLPTGGLTLFPPAPISIFILIHATLHKKLISALRLAFAIGFLRDALDYGPFPAWTLVCCANTLWLARYRLPAYNRTISAIVWYGSLANASIFASYFVLLALAHRLHFGPLHNIFYLLYSLATGFFFFPIWDLLIYQPLNKRQHNEWEPNP